MSVLFVNLTQTGVSWEAGPSVDKCFRLIGLWSYLWGLFFFLTVDSFGRAPPTVGIATTGQMVLGCACIRKQAEQALGDEPAQCLSEVSAAVLPPVS